MQNYHPPWVIGKNGCQEKNEKLALMGKRNKKNWKKKGKKGTKYPKSTIFMKISKYMVKNLGKKIDQGGRKKRLTTILYPPESILNKYNCF